MSQEYLVTELTKQGFGKRLAGSISDAKLKLKLRRCVNEILDKEVAKWEAKQAYEEL